jgi:hypothetical protein
VRTITERAFVNKHAGKRVIEDMRLERCTFDDCAARKTTFRYLELVECRIRGCSLWDMLVEEVVVDGLRMTLGGRGGKRDPLTPYGLLAKHLVLRGRINGFIWNPSYPSQPWFGLGLPGPQERQTAQRRSRAAARAFYETVDWALDISEARFTSVPSFKFGPPADLIRRDPVTQPVVTRERAAEFDWSRLRDEVGVWSVVLRFFLEDEWPDSIVLTPAWGKAGERDRAGIARLREMGVAV